MQEYQFPNRPNFDLQFNPKMVYYGAIVLVLLWLASGIYTVQQDEQAVVFRFGQAVSLEGPGIHYHMPTPFEYIERERVSEVKRLEVGFRTISVSPTPRYQKVTAESMMLTGDENIVDVELIIQYRIRDLKDYLFNVNDQRKTLKDVAEAAHNRHQRNGIEEPASGSVAAETIVDLAGTESLDHVGPRSLTAR